MTSASSVAPGSLVWEASADGGTFTPVPTTHDEALLPNRTTPFRLGATGPWRGVRVRAISPVTLSQIELFALADAV